MLKRAAIVLALVGLALGVRAALQLQQPAAALALPDLVVEIDGVEMQSVPGGTHWGGGIHINSYDHARFGLLVHREGVWDGRAILPAGWIRDLRTPCPIRPGYGYLWWLNTGHGEWPGASESSYSAVGAGTNIIWIDPDNDLVVVARWMDQASVAEFLGLVSAAAG